MSCECVVWVFSPEVLVLLEVWGLSLHPDCVNSSCTCDLNPAERWQQSAASLQGRSNIVRQIVLTSVGHVWLQGATRSCRKKLKVRTGFPANVGAPLVNIGWSDGMDEASGKMGGDGSFLFALGPLSAKFHLSASGSDRWTFIAAKTDTNRRCRVSPQTRRWFFPMWIIRWGI